MKGTYSIVLGVSVCILLAGSILFGRQQSGELAGIRGLPVTGHDLVAGVVAIDDSSVCFTVRAPSRP
jgi:hypothetical protein